MRAGIGFGSNLGDRLANLRRARERLLLLPGVDAPVVSGPLFESSPVDCDESAAEFLNTVVEVQLADSADPEQFLADLRQIEVAMGRPSRHPKNSSRPIDLDLLYVDALELHTSQLTLPHPRLHERRFVLAPLAALRPELRLPGRHQTVADLLESLPDPAGVRLVSASW